MHQKPPPPANEEPTSEVPSQRWAPLGQQEARATPPAREPRDGNREYVTTKDEPLTLPREAYLRSQGEKKPWFSVSKQIQTPVIERGIPPLPDRNQDAIL